MKIISTLGMVLSGLIAIHPFSSEFYLKQFPRNAIEYVRDTICNAETNVIYVYYDEIRSSVTTNNLLRKLNSCTLAPVLVKTYRNEVLMKNVNRRKYVSIHVLIVQQNRPGPINNAIRVIHPKVEGKQYLKYFMIFESFQDIPDWIAGILRRLWLKRLLNVIVMYYDGIIVRSYTHNPFTTEGFAVKELTFFNQSNWYYDKLTDLRGKVLNVSMFDDDIRSIAKRGTNGFRGSDGYLSELIAMKLNSKFNYIHPLDNETTGSFENNTANGGLADVKEDRAEFSFNVRFMNPEFQDNNVETTNSYERDDLCVLVPKAGRKPTFYNIFRTMSRMTWALTITTILLTVTVYNVIQSVHQKLLVMRNRDENKRSTWVDTFMIINQSLYGASIGQLPTTLPLRLLFAGWLFYSFLMTSLYTGKLVRKLAYPRYRDDIETLEDLKKSGLEIVVRSSFVPMLEKNFKLEPKFWKAIQGRIVSLNAKAFKEHFVNNKTNVAYAMEKYQAEYAVFQNYDKKTGRPQYHKMRDCLIYYPRTYIVGQGSPYLGRVNELLSRFHEVGLVRFWDQLSEFEATIKGKFIDDDDFDDNEVQEDEDGVIKVILSIEHLEGAFYILTIGLGASFVVFVIEIFWARYVDYKLSLVVYL